MNKPILAIDVDEPIVQTGKMWERWLNSHYTMRKEYKLLQPDPKPYNLSEMFIIPEHETGFEYFDYFTLYDNVSPREDALEYLPILIKHFDIIFVSKIMGNHYCSKLRMLDKYFPYHKGFYGCSKTKVNIKCDILVDDCFSNLNDMYEKHGNDVTLLKFRADYNERVEPLKHYRHVYSWEQISNILLGDK